MTGTKSNLPRLFSTRLNLSPKLSWRVGIHLDDIIIEGDNIYGNGVNIAARLESQSPVGEILISEVVKQQIHNKIDETIHALGKIEKVMVGDIIRKAKVF